MKLTFFFLVLLAGIAAASGALMSKASWIGRVGITFFYQEYNLLKIWWQGAIAVFLVFILLFLLHTFIYNKLSAIAARGFYVLMLLLAVVGFYSSYDDFTHNFSHRLLGWRFHLGFYLVWCGWAVVSLFFLFKRKPQTPPGGKIGGKSQFQVEGG